MLRSLLILITLFYTPGQTLNICSNSTGNYTKSSLKLVTHSKPSLDYFGFGPVKVDCSGVEPDNSTEVYWIRNNQDGVVATLNSTIVTHKMQDGKMLWRATLHDEPPETKFPYTYECVVTNKCGNTYKSPLITVKRRSFPIFPPSACSKGLEKLQKLKVEYNVNQRTVEVSWKYVLAKEDTGFLLEWKEQQSKQTSKIELLNSTTRRYVISNLVPFTTYDTWLQVRYGNCSSLRYHKSVETLQDYPSFPRNLTAVVLTRNSLNVTWLPSKFPNGRRLNYKLFWKKIDDGNEYENKSVSSHLSHVIKNLSANSNYSVAILASNMYGDGQRTPSIYTFTSLKELYCSDLKGIKKDARLDVEYKANQRTVEVSWKYVLDKEDTGFRLKWKENQSMQTSKIDFNSTTRRHIIDNLVPFTKYHMRLQILYGNCRTFRPNKSVETLEDFPGLARNLKATVINSNAVNLTWLQPKFPNGKLLEYQISWTRVNVHDNYTTIQVPLRNFRVIPELVPNTNYSFEILVTNTFGTGERTRRVYAQTEPIASERTGECCSNSGAIAGAVVAVATVLILILVGLFLFRKLRAKKRRQQSLKSFQELHEVTQSELLRNSEGSSHQPPVPEPLSPKFEDPAEISYIVLLDDWEISRDNLTILEKKLGGGQFGIVKQGLFSNGKQDAEIVAVKMLKDGASASDRSDLVTELKILKEVNKDPHPNVLALIGSCSTTEPLLIVTEFCSGGSLRKFLLNSRVNSKDDSPKYINLTSTLTHRQLLKVAVDVASGMIHLASYKFVHRDLAARNVLIGENDTAKLSDFGLARDVKETEEYIRSNQNLLPVKWMALESLLHGRFTTSSDIWSFGILLYEIATLGDEPYKGISPYNIVSHVGSGCRMEKPPHCSDEVYTIMRNCWKVDPNERPSFDEIHEALYSMLTDDQKCYINVTQMADEGPLRVPNYANSPSNKESSIRYTKA